MHSTKALKRKEGEGWYVHHKRDARKKKKKKISSLNWCTSETQLADCLTKATASSSKLISLLNRECDIIKVCRALAMLIKLGYCCWKEKEKKL